MKQSVGKCTCNGDSMQILQNKRDYFKITNLIS